MEIKKEIIEIKEEIKEIKQILLELKTEIYKTNNSCSKMNEHINFVENVYDGLKRPIEYVKNSFQQISYTDTNANDIKKLN
jgi:chromosome segregation ATPase